MKATAVALGLFLLALPAWAGTASAQVVQGTQPVVLLDAQLERGMLLVERNPTLGHQAHFVFNYQDLSIESVNSQTSGVDFHRIQASLRWKDNVEPDGWTFDGPTWAPMQTHSNEKGSGQFFVTHDPGVQNIHVEGILSLNISSDSGPYRVVEVPWEVQVLPSPAMQIVALPPAKERVAPYGRVPIQVRVTNVDAYPSSFRVAARIQPAEGIDPTNTFVMGEGVVYLDAYETQVVTLEVLAPRARSWYRDVPLLVTVGVMPTSGGAEQTVVHILSVNGFYWSENLTLLILAALAQIALLLFLIIFGRRAYERRYLGRPIPPWQIPEEASNLERLKRENPRAHYVLRYFLMEEEYRSALLWFYAYKKISKKKLKAEIRAIELREQADELVSLPAERFDRSSARLQRRYARRMERAEARTQKRIERLQGRLERTYEKDYEKDHGKWEKKVEKLQKKHNQPYLKAKAKWDKQTKAILDKWEKPFRKEKKKHEEALAKAKEAYAKKVKKADKDTWRAWREQMEDWEQENKIRKKEGRELAPEPALLSSIAGPPEFPAPFQEPPKPQLPSEPKPENIIDLPPEPLMGQPDLWASHYAKKAKKVQKKGAKELRALELDLASKLNDLRHKRDAAGIKVEEKREKLIAESQTVATRSTTFVDRVLRRSADDVERRHHIAYLRGLTKERIQELREVEEANIERVRVQGTRAQADLEAKILLERAEARKATKTGNLQDAQARNEKVASLVRQLGELKIQNGKKLETARRESKARLDAAIVRLKEEERQRIEAERAHAPAAPDAEPAQS